LYSVAKLFDVSFEKIQTSSCSLELSMHIDKMLVAKLFKEFDLRALTEGIGGVNFSILVEI